MLDLPQRGDISALSLSLTLFANAGASGVALDELYRHPVTQSDVQELLSSVALGGDVGPEELARLVFFAGIDLSPDGTAHVATGAEMTPAIDPDLRAVQEVVYFGAPNMGQVLSAAADLAPDAWMEVEIAVARSAFDDGTTADGALLLAAARGEVVTISDAYAVREKWIADREASTAPALDQLEEDIWILGGRVLSRFGLAGTLRAELPADAVAALEFTDNVQSVSAGESGSDDAGFAWYVDGGDVDGYELEDLLQSWQFTEYGLDGFVSAFEHTAVLEPNGDKILVGHQGFRDGAGATRVTNCPYDPALPPGMCLLPFVPDPFITPKEANEHSTAVASIIGGDISLGQDPLISDPLQRRMRSGLARGALVQGYGTTSMSHLSFSVLLQRIRVANMSFSYTSDTLCRGNDSHSKDYNALYESGLAIFKSAGNDGFATPGDCTVGSPGAALGVFPVGAYQINSTTHTEEFYLGTSRGGTSAEGAGRTIIGLMAPSMLEYAYPYYMWPLDSLGFHYEYGVEWPGVGTGPSSFCCTSAAAPVITGAAQLFRDFFYNTFSNPAMIDDPGLLYTNMLLMGSRHDEGGALMVNGFDGLTGAGKLHLRRFEGAWMDPPARYKTGWACVPFGGITEIPLSVAGGPAALSGDEDFIKVVTWWYDRRWDDGGVHDFVDLQIIRKVAGVWSPVVTANSDDNRQRLYLDEPGAYEYGIRLIGRDISSPSGEGCGPFSHRVYFAALAEDNDREVAERPLMAFQVRPE